MAAMVNGQNTLQTLLIQNQQGQLNQALQPPWQQAHAYVPQPQAQFPIGGQLFQAQPQFGMANNYVQQPINNNNGLGGKNPPRNGLTVEEIRRICEETVGPAPRRTARSRYTKPYPERVENREYPRGFKFPDFALFSGDDYQSTIAHISRFTARCAEHSRDDDLKLKWFENSLTGPAHAWYVNLAPNSIQNWADMERAFHEQFYRVEPEVTIADLAKMYQEAHESAQDFLDRFKAARNKCIVNLGELEFVRIAQQGLNYELRKKYEGVDIRDIFELTTSVARYEAIIREETQARSASKGTYYKNPTVHVVEANFQGLKVEEEDSADINAAEIFVNKPVVCKALAKPTNPIKDKPQPITYHTKDGTPLILTPTRTYTFDITKADIIFDQLLAEKVIKLPNGHVIPKADETRNKSYCKFHNSWKHSTNNFVVYRDALQDLIEKGKLKFPETSKPAQLVDTDPFPVNMVYVNFPRGHRRNWPNMNLSDPRARRRYMFHDQRREPVYDSQDEDA
ncbi:uncharacterized protein LOC112202998 [Rosa chinensis]|uniref:uncharacterized protein LOC112202998 n=1 Tax=Rosa chinensis TaxID=74649 RepID=UPI000D08D9D0|nr:uncharacterized protein LOC112202998 [Rosa chinensis]